MTPQTSFLVNAASGGSPDKHTESCLSGKSIPRFTRLIGILLFSLFGAHSVAHAFGAIAQGTYSAFAFQVEFVGISNNQPTPQAAREAAVEQCIEHSMNLSLSSFTYNNDCAPLIGYSNQWAVAFTHITENLTNYGFGADMAAAVAAATAACNADPDISNKFPCPQRGTAPNHRTHVVAGDTINTCPAGHTFNDQGTTDSSNPAHTLDDTCDSSCTGDQVANSAGNCVCPDGEEPSGGTSCTACTGGEFSTGGAACQECGYNRAPNANKTACIECWSAFQSSGPNSRINLAVSSDRTMCVTCPANMVSRGLLNDTAAVKFRVSKTVGNDHCTLCPAGTSKLPGAFPVCGECDTGQISTPGEACRACPVGDSSITDADHTTCDVCMPGTTPNSNKDGCDNCPSGQVSDGGTCAACSSPRVPNSDNSACMCPSSGYIENNGTCEACTGGKTSNTAGDACICPTGEIDNNGT